MSADGVGKDAAEIPGRIELSPAQTRKRLGRPVELVGDLPAYDSTLIGEHDALDAAVVRVGSALD